jgi:hypothetical protein
VAAVAGYGRLPDESVDTYVSRIQEQASRGLISSGPGGSLLSNAINQARGFAPGSGGRAQNQSQSVSDAFFNTVRSDPAYQAGSANRPVTRTGPSQLSAYNPGMADTNPVTSTPNITPGMDAGEFEKARQSILYNLQNPEFALSNALQAKGLSLYNPIIRRGILPSAQGLGNAFAVQGALGNNGAGTDVAGGFSNFLQQALSGAGGGIRGVTQGALGNLGKLGESLWSAANAQNAGQVPTNPFLGALLSTLYDPQALTGLQTSLALPNLGPSLTSGLQELLGLKSNLAWQQIQPTENFYKYLTP